MKTLRALSELFSLLSIAHISLSNTEPCSTPLGSETFITDVPENTEVGSVIGVLDVYGSPTEVNLTQQNNDVLHLDSQSRNISLKKALDTDQPNINPNIILQVFCNKINNNNNNNNQVIPLTVRVIVVDVNDNPPIFPRSRYFVNVPESTPVGSIISSNTTATDADQPNGGNDQVVYSIIPGAYTEYFEIEYPFSPKVMLKKALDYETVKEMTIGIMAEDVPLNGQALSASTLLTIFIQDSDDLPPKFLSSNGTYFGTVEKNSIPGTEVPVAPPIKAVDGDKLNASIKYELQDPLKKFVIDDTTGVVRVDNLLETGTFSLFLRALQRDNLAQEGWAFLQITVTGETENAPFFQYSKYETVVSESEKVGSIITTISATDLDQWATLQYTIVGNPPQFSVDNRGNIKLTQSLDYEAQTEYIFNLTVTDSYSTTWTQVVVYVTDVNDNNPEVNPKEVTLTKDKRVPGERLITIKASDRDPNTTLQFQLKTHARDKPKVSIDRDKPEVSVEIEAPLAKSVRHQCDIIIYKNLFQINDRGEITTLGTEEELTEDTYHLVVSVRDNGVPQRETVALVVVKFPPLDRAPITSAPQMAGENTDILAIVLGALAAVLLLVIVFLILYIIRRRQYIQEQLDRAKIRLGRDPRGLTYRAGDPSPEPFSDDGTTVVKNPLSHGGRGFTYDPDDLPEDLPEVVGGQDMEEIHIDTAVTPYGEDYDPHRYTNGYGNGALRTFHAEEGSSSGDSHNSDSTGDSNKGLMKNKKVSSSKGHSQLNWGGSSPVSTFGSDASLQEDVGPPPKKDKPEITVYF